MIERTTGSGSGELGEAFVYTYLTSGVNAGLLSGVVQETQTGGGSWTTVLQVAYTYYGSGSGNGVPGELQLATVENGSGTALATSYYRYYTSGTGSSGNIAYSFGPQAYALLTAALARAWIQLDAHTRWPRTRISTIQYNASGQVSSSDDRAGAGRRLRTGQGTYTYAYTTNTSADGFIDHEHVDRPRPWRRSPDGTTNTVFTNGLGEVMLSVYTDASSNKWLTYNRYDAVGSADPRRPTCRR